MTFAAANEILNSKKKSNRNSPVKNFGGEQQESPKQIKEDNANKIELKRMSLSKEARLKSQRKLYAFNHPIFSQNKKSTVLSGRKQSKNPLVIRESTED